MPYYCTVPRCTSMAGKAKNVSFHQFPRDEELAKLWNKILKRGKPYTKYSKVCSLHFTPNDYTSIGKNKGQWRTLRKNAIPSQNLPTESPIQKQRQKNTGSWVTNGFPSTVMESQINQVAHVIYMQTMLAMQAAAGGDVSNNSFHCEQSSPSNWDGSNSPSSNNSSQFNATLKQIEQLLNKNNIKTDVDSDSSSTSDIIDNEIERLKNGYMNESNHTYKCLQCSKYFKDPDVFTLHKRMHTTNENKEVLRSMIPENVSREKENIDGNAENVSDKTTEETLKANPILANLLKSNMPQALSTRSEEVQRLSDDKNVLSIENQIMAALSSNMENYLRSLTSTMANSGSITDNFQGNINVDINEENLINHTSNNMENVENNFKEQHVLLEAEDNLGSNCDKNDMNESIVSNTLVNDMDSEKM